jgi:hypothetical protein
MQPPLSDFEKILIDQYACLITQLTYSQLLEEKRIVDGLLHTLSIIPTPPVLRLTTLVYHRVLETRLENIMTRNIHNN